jgi:hypothetical protein
MDPREVLRNLQQQRIVAPGGWNPCRNMLKHAENSLVASKPEKNIEKMGW